MRDLPTSQLAPALCLALAAGFAVACAGADDAAGPEEESGLAPDVLLRVKVPRQDVEPKDDSTSIAHGEAVILAWETQHSPVSCTATGAWSASLNRTGGGQRITRSLGGPATYDFGVRCENRAGSGSDRVSVRVAAAGERLPRSNRPDVTNAPQVKVLYVLPSDIEGRHMVRGGWLAQDVKAFQEWFASETRSDSFPHGRKFRMDRFEGRLDIPRLRLHQPASVLANWIKTDILEAVTDRIDEAGFIREETLYLVYFDGPWGGGVGDVDALVGYSPTVPLEVSVAESPIAVHMLAHTRGIVDEDAPNYEAANPVGHVDDFRHDLMSVSIGHYELDVALDDGRDDYYNESGLPNGIANLANSPYLMPAGN